MLLIEFYDSVFRFWAAGLFVLMGILILRDTGTRVASVFGALSTFCAAGYLLASQPGAFENWGHAYHFVGILASMAPASAWIFSLSQFEDGFRLRRVHLVMLALYVVIWALDFDPWQGIYFPKTEYFDMSETAMQLSFLAHMVYVAWRGRADDLLEVRRRFRTIVVVVTIAFIASIVVMEAWFPELRVMPEVTLVQAFAFLIFGMAVVWYGLRLEKGVLLVADQNRQPDAKAFAIRAEQLEDPNERHDLRKITTFVAEGRGYLEANLTIASLADTLEMPEHRLRRLINKHMGYRNFSDFLNHYRIEEAKRILADTNARNKQILVIAMDVGYGSLGPFNRAFKERTGQTPTEYKKDALLAAD